MSAYMRPSIDDIDGLAAEWNFSVTDEERPEFYKLLCEVGAITDTVESSPTAPVEDFASERNAGRRPAEGEDPYNAVVRFCSVLPRGEGSLTGLRIGVKDSIAIAGIPSSAGSTLLGDYVPDRDSEVVRRVLKAGGEIVATLNMDNLAFSGGGESSAHGPTRSPFDLTRAAGGSSGGSGSALYYEGIDVTLGTDQGGSIRAPAAWTGTVGLKPTFGLVSYSGILGIDQQIDHVGPMGRRTEDVARILQVIAGRDEGDPRQVAPPPLADYIGAVERAGEKLNGISVGRLEEGFSAELGVDDQTRGATEEAIERFERLGANIRTVSVPEHLTGSGLAFTGFLEGIGSTLSGGGNTFGHSGAYYPQMARAVAEGLRERTSELSNQMKLALIYGSHMRRQYGGAVYAEAANRKVGLRAAYDKVLREVDFLLLPTMPTPPMKIDSSLPLSERVMRGWSVLSNAVLTNVTGHPAISIPAGEAGGLPVGLMLIGKHFDDAGLLSLSSSYENAFGWLPGVENVVGVPTPAN